MCPMSMESPRGSSAIIMEMCSTRRLTARRLFSMESPRGSSAIIMEIGRSLIFLTSRLAARLLHSHVHSLRAQEGALPSSWRSARSSIFSTWNLKLAACHLQPNVHGDSAQEGALSSSCRSAARRFFNPHTHGEPKRELCHHHGILQKNPQTS